MKNQYLTSIDIGSTHIAIVGCDVLSQQELSINQASLTSSQGIDKGYISNVEQATLSLTQALNDFEKKYKRSITSASFSIGALVSF